MDRYDQEEVNNGGELLAPPGAWRTGWKCECPSWIQLCSSISRPPLHQMHRPRNETLRHVRDLCRWPRSRDQKQVSPLQRSHDKWREHIAPAKVQKILTTSPDRGPVIAVGSQPRTSASYHHQRAVLLPQSQKCLISSQTNLVRRDCGRRKELFSEIPQPAPSTTRRV